MESVERRKVSAGVGLADHWGYSRALRVGDRIEVAGTGAWNPDGTVFAPDDAYAQAKEVIARIEAAIEELGGELGDVVRTRAFLRDVEDFEAVGRAHKEAFAGIDPVSTAVGGLTLLAPEMRVEIEATAIVKR